MTLSAETYQPLANQASCLTKTLQCGAGEYVSNPNSVTSDRACVACQSGTAYVMVFIRVVLSWWCPLQAPTSPAPSVLPLVARLRPTPVLRVDMSATRTRWWLTTAAHCAHKVPSAGDDCIAAPYGFIFRDLPTSCTAWLAVTLPT
jgi:hypothetical protein